MNDEPAGSPFRIIGSSVSMKFRGFNWPIWLGFLLSVVAFLSYFFVFIWFPVTRDFPWANLLLFALAVVFLVLGIRRAFSDQSHPRRSRVVGAAVAVLSVAILGSFIFTTLIMARWLPASHGAPQVGRKAPDFNLADTSGKPTSLTELLSTPINGKPVRGVLLIFYRGYW
jgi:hypothetical protein